MSLPPQLSFLRIGSPSAPHTLEIWLDYVCPYCAKMMKNAINPILKPAITTGHLKDKVQLLIRLQVQPWHGSSLFTHEAAIAVGKVAPQSFWEFHTLLFENQQEYFDRNVANLTPLQIREKLVALAGRVPSIDESKLPEIQDMLTYKSTLNGGNDVTDDIKWFIKVGRQDGIHVSPTVLWDGLKNDNISSSWLDPHWNDFFTKSVKV